MKDAADDRDWLIRATELQRQMQRFLDHLSSAKRNSLISTSAGWHPSIDVYEREGHIVVVADAAGVEPSRTAVVIEGQTLTISGRRELLHSQGARYHRLEVAWGDFERSIDLPAAVDASRAKARLSAGLLEITLPIAQRPQPAPVRLRVAGSKHRR